MEAYITFDDLQNSLYNNISCFEKKFINLSYYTVIFVGSDWFGVPFPKLQIFSGICWVLLIDYSLCEKEILGVLVYLFICEIMTANVNFHFYKQCSQAATLLICERAIFVQNASLVFSSDISLHIEKIIVEKLWEGSGNGTYKICFLENQVKSFALYSTWFHSGWSEVACLKVMLLINYFMVI